MARVKCPNGHVFDTNLNGNQCPLCQAIVGGGAAPAAGPAVPPPAPSTTPHTHIGGVNATPRNQPQPGMNPNPVGSTHISAEAQNAQQQQSRQAANPVGGTLPNRGGGAAAPGGRTVIRRVDPNGGAGKVTEGRKLVGFLVCYNRYPNGKAFNLYEGRNYIGRDASCDICIPDDNQLSGRHMSIMYRNVDNKFKFRDEQSSNGTFINKELKDDGELENYDIIRLGSTLFIFMPIPQVF